MAVPMTEKIFYSSIKTKRKKIFHDRTENFLFYWAFVLFMIFKRALCKLIVTRFIIIHSSGTNIISCYLNIIINRRNIEQ